MCSKCVWPRQIFPDPYTLWSSANQLRKFGHDRPVLIQFIVDQEARNFGTEILDGLQNRVWRPKVITEQDSGIRHIPVGVTIYFWGGVPKSEAAAQAFREWIRFNSTFNFEIGGVEAAVRPVPPVRTWPFRHSPAIPEWSLQEYPFKGFHPLPPQDALLVLIGQR
jgi:hypothetical protein